MAFFGEFGLQLPLPGMSELGYCTLEKGYDAHKISIP